MIFGYAGLANATEISSTSSGTYPHPPAGSATPHCYPETRLRQSLTIVSSPTGSTAGTACATSSGSSGGIGSSAGGSSTAVGAGVGVSLGAALAGALAWGFWERRKRLQEGRAARGMPGMGPAEAKPMYAGYSSIPRAPYPPQPPQAYSPQPCYPPPQPSYSPHPAQIPPQVPGELPHHGANAVELMDNPRQY